MLTTIQHLAEARKAHKMPPLRFRDTRSNRNYLFYIENNTAAFFSHVGQDETFNTRLNVYDLTDLDGARMFRAMCGRKIKFIKQNIKHLSQ